MATWGEFERAEPEMAAKVKARFTFTKHHVLATLRKNGAPRVSGTEVVFDGGDIELGSMSPAVKASDLLRDGRYALHSNPDDGSLDGGDAKLSGRAFAIDDPTAEHHRFRLEVDSVVLVYLNEAGDRLVVDSWLPGQGIKRTERD